MDPHGERDIGGKGHSESLFGAFVVSAMSWGVHLFVTMVIVLFMVIIVPRYDRWFAAHDAMLPPITQLYLRLSRSIADYWPWLAVAMIAVNGPIALGVQFLPRRMRWLKVCWFDSYLVVAIVFLFFGSLALWLPLEGIFEQDIAARIGQPPS